ncbi:isochorismatase, partial [Basidiobolus meristosporus CBS 931.73]
VQLAFDDVDYWGGHRNNPDCEENIARLLKAWRASARMIFHIQHCSTEPGSLLRPERPGNAFKAEAVPHADEPVFKKTVNSAFIGTPLESELRRNKCTTVFFVGLTTNHCVETSVRMSGNLGFNTFLVDDACATFDRVGPNGKKHRAEDIHEMTLSNLNGEFCTIAQTKEILIAMGH